MFHFNAPGGINIGSDIFTKTVRVISAALLSCCFVLSVTGCSRSINRDKRPEHDTSVMMPANSYLLKDAVEVKGRQGFYEGYDKEISEVFIYKIGK